MITNQHAANLRGMATQLVADQLIQNKRWTKAGLSVLNEGYLSAQAKYERGVAALLAGAEALEAVEVAKAALRGLVAALEEVHQDPYYQRVWNVHQLHCGPYKGKQYEAELEQATAALARLEGK